MTLLFVVVAVAIAAAAATIHQLTTDGYHRVPTCSEGAHHYR